MSPHSDAGELAGKTALAAVAAAIACCGIPLLIAAGLTAAAGVALGSLTLIAAAAALLAWVVVRAVRQAPPQGDTEPPRAGHEDANTTNESFDREER
ncbi:MAG: hypothetical protein WD080_10560 [Egibacteraceae bacterium]